jgi:hypothetical protein
LLPEAGAFYVLDRGYVDFARLYIFTQACAFFITRSRKDLQFYRRYSCPVERSAGLRCDQTILLTGVRTAKRYPDPLRRIHYLDVEKDLRLTFLTNNFLLSALTIAQLNRAASAGSNSTAAWFDSPCGSILSCAPAQQGDQLSVIRLRG